MVQILISMAKQKQKKTDKQDIDIELKSLIKQNENLATGMKKNN